MTTGALARYEELREIAQRPRRARRPATPREVLDRLVAAYNERDWDALRDVLATDVRFVDRRLVGWGEFEGPDAHMEFIEGGVALAPDLRLGRADRAGRPRRGRPLIVRGHLAEGGGEFEIAT